ncbi:carbamoyltransferase [Candidatus Leptofilum sp.]|uniref:carbamoyltransferase family protein n=1 Tax=Candidatus Leptofilum sp. TaxID=3241576 RepID=UPI003B590C4E
MYILGISCFYHDAAAALLHDGILVAAAEEERFSRKKHDFDYPKNAIEFCLQEAGITSQDLDYVVFYEKPLLKFERILLTTLQTFPKSWGVFRESMITWFNEKLWVKGQILTSLNVPDQKLLFVEHHLSHAASAFFCSPYEEAAILTVDGVGEWTTATVGKGTAGWQHSTNGHHPPSSNSIELFSEVKFPHSLGLLYSAFTAFLGFRVNNGEYKVMGMAPYGQPTRMEDVYKLIEVGDDASFRLNMDYFSFHHSTKQTFSNKFVELFGEPRVHDSIFYTPTTHPKKDHPRWDEETAKRNQHYADIAASIQRVTEDMMLRMVNYAHKTTGLKNLCMAGGVALNSVANGRIMREGPFENVYIQPAAGDSGGALGAALYAYHVLLGKPRQFVMENAYLGKAYTPDEINAAIEATGFPYERIDDMDKKATMMVEDIMASKVISLYQGRFEWGPRALGNRSILADPRSAEMKSVVNERIKFREPFRPFAPVVLEERAPEFWENLGNHQGSYPYRYMLAVCQTKEDKQDLIQAVNHNGSGRIQTVRREWNPLYYRAIELFGEATGVPVLLNTSFNLRGEPIVTTPENALNTFAKSDIDSLYMDGYVIRKS